MMDYLAGNVQLVIAILNKITIQLYFIFLINNTLCIQIEI